MSTLLARLLTLVVAVLASLAPLLAAGPARAGEDPDVGRPEVGSCHDLTYQQTQAETDPAPATPCEDPRTLITVGVLDAGSDPDWDSEQLFQRSATGCFGELVDYFGARDARRLAMTSYEPFLFYPTPAERRAGATWVRCDVGLVADTAVLDLPRRPSLRPVNRGVEYCLAPKRKDYRQTVCSRPHAFRAEAAVEGPTGRYPTKREWGELSVDYCPPRAPYWFAPTKASFNGGLRYLVCFAKTQD